MTERGQVTVSADAISTPRASVQRADVRRLLYDAARGRLSFLDGQSKSRLTAAVSPRVAAAIAADVELVLEERCKGVAGYRWPAALMALTLAAMGLAVMALRSFLAPILPMLPVMTVVLCAVVMSVFRLRAGRHGIVESRLWIRRHHPYGTIARVEETDAGIVVHLRSGAKITFALGGLMQASLRRTVVESFAARVREGIARHSSNAARAEARSALEPGGLAAREWIARLRVLRGDDYRGGRPAEGALWEILEDPAEDEASRSAAALLLRLHPDEAQATRIRVAIDDDASAALREALEAVADDEHARAETAAAALASRQTRR